MFVGERSALPQIPFCHRLHLYCIQIVKMEGVQPLDGNEGNAPGLRFPMNKLLLAVSVIQGLGLALCLTYVCLHFQASQVRRCTGHLAPASSCWRHCQQLQTVPYTRADARFFLFLSLSVTAKCGETPPPPCPPPLFSFLLLSSGGGGAQGRQGRGAAPGSFSASSQCEIPAISLGAVGRLGTWSH